MCKARNLNYRQSHLYHWKWEFRGNELHENKRYNILYEIHLPNSCAQSEGWSVLRITNVFKPDLGQYSCAVVKSNITLAKDDVLLPGIGMIFCIVTIMIILNDKIIYPTRHCFQKRVIIQKLSKNFDYYRIVPKKIRRRFDYGYYTNKF